MAKQTINYGITANDGLGDPLRTAMVKSKENFDELYAAEVLNTAKVTNATHTGDVTGDTLLTIAGVNANVGTFVNTTLTVNAKGQITAASNGTSMTKYSSTVNLAAAATTQKVTTVTTEPYSILLLDSSDVVITDTVEISLSVVGGVYVLDIYSLSEQLNVKIKIIY